eukprot:c26450_g1_i1.p1 GENE.c26450_g1_i1~~c26450_g1_i1.p1  ORF type:complete len:288 (-),score=58.51 c26450_g1_i1:68-886(-)
MFDKTGGVLPDGGGDGNDYSAHRQKLRERAKVNVWAKSDSEDRSSSENEGKRSRKRHRSRSASSSSSGSGSDSSDRRRAKKEKKKERKRHKKEKRDKKKSKHRKHRKDDKDEERSKGSDSSSASGGEWVEKSPIHKFADEDGGAPQDEGGEVGPVPAKPKAAPKLDTKGYKANMLPGEADAIASFVQQNKRIPRRGEVGLTSDEIQNFEGLGYVMSGSRHKRMNAVRIRKENQIYSAEEKRALLSYNHEEKMARESEILQGFKSLVARKFGN